MKHASAVVVLIALSSMGLSVMHPFGNPRYEPRKGLASLLQGADISPEAKKVLVNKCADCHSNETRWPVYSRLAPGSWLIEMDIAKARSKMNLSHWDDLSADTKDVLIAKIIHEAKEGDMPPLQYRTLHWGSALTQADTQAILSMSKTTLVDTASGAAGDATRGELLFQRRCTGCHALEANREGPRLGGVFGRMAGSVTGFEYSAGLKHSDLKWDETTLEKWLADPDSIAPDTKMDFHVPKAQERADLIAYFKR